MGRSFEMNLSSFQPGGSSSPSSQVEISVRCSGLADRDLTSKSDPTCILLVPKTAGNNDWTEFGRTEKILDSLDPHWQTKFVIDYRFEERQMLRFAVYDIDSDRLSNLSDHDSLGQGLRQEADQRVRNDPSAGGGAQSE